MSLLQLKDSIGDFGRDTRLNLESLFGPDGTPGLAPTQQWGTALAVAFATREQDLVTAVEESGAEFLTPEIMEGAKAAASIMAMNNIYYRFLHLAEDKEISKLPARLRMNVIGKPGIPKVDFELMSLAISALSGCGACINSHVAELKKAGVTHEGIQSAIKIAAVLNAAEQSLFISP